MRLKQLLIAIDQLCNTIGGGYADETLSSRAWRHRGGSPLYRWIDRIFFWDKNHCKQSYESELLRRQLPPGMRGILQTQETPE